MINAHVNHDEMRNSDFFSSWKFEDCEKIREYKCEQILLYFMRMMITEANTKIKLKDTFIFREDYEYLRYLSNL